VEVRKPGGWLFGDLGRPFLEETAFSLILSELPRPEATNLHRLVKRAHKLGSLKSTNAMLKNREKLRAEVSALLSEANKVHNRELESITFKSAFFGIENEMLLKELPWLPETWDHFEAIGLSPENSVFDLAGLTWGELAGISTPNWVVVFDVYQMIFSWLETAIQYPVRISNFDSLSIEIEKFERSVILRAGLTGVPSMKWADLLSIRLGWGQERKTLEEIAGVWGLSRERVRQIESQLIRIAQSRPQVPSSKMRQLLELDYERTDVDPMTLIRKQFELSDEWSLHGLANYIEFGASADDSSIFRAATGKSSPRREKNIELEQAIRKARTTLGVIRTNAITLPGQADPVAEQFVLDQIPLVYGFALFSGHFAVVSGKANTPGILTVISKQLAVAPKLHVDRLQEGIRRKASQVQAQHALPPTEDLIVILKKSGFFEVDAQNLVSGRTEETPQENAEGWLLNRVASARGQVISKAQIMRLAMAENYKISTIGIYMSFSPLIRYAEESLLTVVGASPSEQDIEYARSVADAGNIPNEVLDYRVDSETQELVIRFVYSTPFLINGILPVSRLLGGLIGSNKKSIFCCEDFSTDASARLASGSMIVGFSPIREHVFDGHSVREGDPLTIIVRETSVSFSW
jgi:hypothetical protein